LNTERDTVRKESILLIQWKERISIKFIRRSFVVSLFTPSYEAFKKIGKEQYFSTVGAIMVEVQTLQRQKLTNV